MKKACVRRGGVSLTLMWRGRGKKRDERYLRWAGVLVVVVVVVGVVDKKGIVEECIYE